MKCVPSLLNRMSLMSKSCILFSAVILPVCIVRKALMLLHRLTSLHWKYCYSFRTCCLYAGLQAVQAHLNIPSSHKAILTSCYQGSVQVCPCNPGYPAFWPAKRFDDIALLLREVVSNVHKVDCRGLAHELVCRVCCHLVTQRKCNCPAWFLRFECEKIFARSNVPKLDR